MQMNVNYQKVIYFESLLRFVATGANGKIENYYVNCL